MAEVNPALNQGHKIEVSEVPTEPENITPVLGGVATREEYRESQVEGDAQVADPRQFERNWDEKMALDESIDEAEENGLNPIATNEDIPESDLDGFTVHDSTAPEGDVDELPEDLQDDLGEPDDDEAHAA